MPRRHFPFLDHEGASDKCVTGEGVSQLEIRKPYHQFFIIVVAALSVCNA